MSRYITLVTLMPGTDNGSDSVGSLTETLSVLLQSGEVDGQNPEVHATLGDVDFVVLADIANPERAAAYAAGVREALDARTVTLTALDAAKIDQALGTVRQSGDRPAIGRGVSFRNG